MDTAVVVLNEEQLAEPLQVHAPEGAAANLPPMPDLSRGSLPPRSPSFVSEGALLDYLPMQITRRG
jgi:hypothetical protein